MVEAFGALREHGVQVLTVGQYLRPTERHLPVVRYWHPDEFKALEARRLRARLRATSPPARSCAELPRRPARPQDQPGRRSAGRRAASPGLFPLKDNIPTDRFPVVTVALIVAQRDRVPLLAAGRVSLGDPSAATRTTHQPRRLRRVPVRAHAPGRALRAGPDGGRLRGPAGRHRHRRAASRRRGSRSSPRCSCTAACCTSAATCCSCGSSATTSRTPWARCGSSSSTCSAGLAARPGRSRRSRRGGADHRGLGRGGRRCWAATSLLFPRARVLTLIFIVFFFTLIELPALVILGFWFVQQVAVRLLRPQQPAGEGGGVAYFAHIGGFVFGLARDQAVRERAQAAAARRSRAGRPLMRTAIPVRRARCSPWSWAS